MIGEEGAGPPGGANGMRAAGGGEVTAFSEVDTGVTDAPVYSFVPTHLAHTLWATKESL